MKARSRRTRIKDPDVAAVFQSYPKTLRPKLMALRQLIIETAAATEGVGGIEETLKWGEPSYLTAESKSGSTIRIAWKEAHSDQVGIYFKCTTNLVDTFRERYPTEFRYGGTRCIIFDKDDPIPVGKLRRCIALALTYHLNKKLEQEARWETVEKRFTK